MFRLRALHQVAFGKELTFNGVGVSAKRRKLPKTCRNGVIQEHHIRRPSADKRRF